VQTKPRTPTLGVVAAPIYARGMRRIERVRVILGAGRPVAEVTGVGHRCPQTFRISVAAALQLADAGVPLRIEDRGSVGNGTA
jgi:hypothetical protein